MPPRTLKLTRRSLTSSSFSIIVHLLLLHFRIKRISQAVTKNIKAKHRNADYCRRENHSPRVKRPCFDRVVNHRTQGCRRGLYTQSQEAEECFREDRAWYR